MPQIRVHKKPPKLQLNNDYMAQTHKYGSVTTKNNQYIASFTSKNDDLSSTQRLSRNQFHEVKSMSQTRPKFDYQKLIDKIQKSGNGENKNESPTYAAATPQHKYRRRDVNMRILHNSIVKKQRHSINFDAFDSVSGDSTEQVYYNFLGMKKSCQQNFKETSKLSTMNQMSIMTNNSNYCLKKNPQSSIFLPAKKSQCDPEKSYMSFSSTSQIKFLKNNLRS